MKTSYFSKYNKLNLKNGISIACSSPNYFNGSEYKKLAPRWELVNNYKKGVVSKKDYVKSYKKQLHLLAAKNVYKDLKNNVLLCWEGPGKFCHRIIVAKWIEKKLGIKVPEL